MTNQKEQGQWVGKLSPNDAVEERKTSNGKDFRRLKLVGQDGQEQWFSAWPRESRVIASKPEAEWTVTYDITTLQSGRQGYWITRAVVGHPAPDPGGTGMESHRVNMPRPQAAPAKPEVMCQHGLGLTARCSGCIKLEVAFKAAVDVLTASTAADGGLRVGLSDVYTVTSRFEQILLGAEFVEGVGLQAPGEQRAETADDDFLEVEV
jgi:hypothetical protein